MKNILIIVFVLFSLFGNSQNTLSIDKFKIVNHIKNTELKINANRVDFCNWIKYQVPVDQNYDITNDMEYPYGDYLLFYRDIEFVFSVHNYIIGIYIPFLDPNNFWAEGHQELANNFTLKYEDKLNIKILMTFQEVRNQLIQNNFKFQERSRNYEKTGSIKIIGIPLQISAGNKNIPIDSSIDLLFSGEILKKIVYRL